MEIRSQMVNGLGNGERDQCLKTKEIEFANGIPEGLGPGYVGHLCNTPPPVPFFLEPALF
jgi:hypothetical protein